MSNFTRILVVIVLFTEVLYGQVFFTEQAASLGLVNSSYGSGSLGAGISFFDFDNDGWDDITLAQQEGSPVKFFQNNQGNFQEVSFNMNQNLGDVKAVTWVDYDNDGDNDFYISTRNEPNQLFRNDGNMQFTDVTLQVGLGSIIARSWGASWGDYDKDGWLDLLQLMRDDGNGRNLLYRNNGDGTFSEVSLSAGMESEGFFSFCGSFFDYDNDGLQDIYIANDRPKWQNLMYRNTGNGMFQEVGGGTGTNLAIDAMSTTIGDYNRDGWFDVYVSNTFDGNAFLRNDGDGTFTDIAAQNGTLMQTYAWGSVFIDAENDGDLDLYVSSQETTATGNPSSSFFENDGNGNYSIPTDAGFANDDAPSYGNAMGDIQNDGYPDIAVLNFEPDDTHLWRNDSPSDNNWLKVKLEGVQSNRMGIGSVIEISVNGQSQYNYTLLGEGYLGQNSAWEFFGIGSANQIDYLRVKWLSGLEDMVMDPPINSHLIVREGEGTVLGRTQVEGAKLDIVPNPAEHTVRFVSRYTGILKVELYTATGKLVGVLEDYAVNDLVDISKYQAGLYIVKVYASETVLISKLIID